MVIIGLYDYFSDSIELWYELGEGKLINLYILVCNNSKSTLIRCSLRHLLRFLKLGFRSKILIVKLFLRKCLIVSSKSLHDESILLWIKEKNPEIGLHCADTIYRKNLISLFRLGIINSHIGILPKYRGRSVMEWTIFNGDPTGITAFFINEDIDTGKDIIFIEEIDVKRFNNILSAKEYLFNSKVRIFKKAINLLLQKNFKFQENEVKKGRRYYIMSKLFKGVVEESLKNGKK